jgi:hypothetical protein
VKRNPTPTHSPSKPLRLLTPKTLATCLLSLSTLSTLSTLTTPLQAKDTAPAISLIEDALNNPLLAENFPEISQALLAQTQNRLTAREIYALAQALSQEESQVHQNLLALLIENSELTEENRKTLALLTQAPPTHKTPKMKMLEKQIETAKAKLAFEPYAQNLLGKSPSFKDLQFLLLIDQKTPENLQALEDAAQCAIKTLGTLPTQPLLANGEPMSWTPSPSQAQRQQNIINAANKALEKAQNAVDQALQENPKP